jgi:hypothetical protein
MLARLEAAVATGCGTLDIQIGVNDISRSVDQNSGAGFDSVAGPYAGQRIGVALAADHCAANVKIVLERAKKAQIPLVILNLEPGAQGFTAGQIGAMNRLNAYYREFGEMYSNVRLFDLPACLWNPTTGGSANNGFIANVYESDPHESNLGAQLGALTPGVGFADFLKTHVPAIPRVLRGNVEGYSANTKSLLTTNMMFTSTGGTKGAGVTDGAAGSGGSVGVASGWSVFVSGSATAQVSTEANPNGPGFRQIVAATFTAAGESVNVQVALPAGELTVASILQALAEVDIDAGSVNFADCYVELNITGTVGGTSTPLQARDNFPLSAGAGAAGTNLARHLTLVTEKLVIPANYVATAGNVRLYMMAAGAGSATARWSAAGVRKRIQN